MSGNTPAPIVPLTADEQAMVEANLGLVGWSINRWYKPRSEADRDDMHQDGVIGLARAVQKFEPAKGFTFATYAVWWVRQAIGRGVEERLGRNYRACLRRGDTWDDELSLDWVPDDGDPLAELLPARDDPEADAVASVSVAALGMVLAGVARDRLEADIASGLVASARAGERPEPGDSVGSRHGVSGSTVSIRRNKLVGRARTRLEGAS